jgi:hypothetical protein
MGGRWEGFKKLIGIETPDRLAEVKETLDLLNAGGYKLWTIETERPRGKLGKFHDLARESHYWDEMSGEWDHNGRLSFLREAIDWQGVGPKDQAAILLKEMEGPNRFMEMSESARMDLIAQSEGRNYFPGDEQAGHRLMGNDDDKRYLAKLQAADMQKGEWSYDQMLKDSERILDDINLDLAEEWSAQQFHKNYDPVAMEADARREEEREQRRVEEGSYRVELEGIAKHEQKSDYDRQLQEAAERAKFSKQEPDKGIER